MASGSMEMGMQVDGENVQPILTGPVSQSAGGKKRKTKKRRPKKRRTKKRRTKKRRPKKRKTKKRMTARKTLSQLRKSLSM